MATSVLVPVHPEGLTLSSANLVGGRVLVLVYLRDACAHVVYIDASTGEPIAASQGVPPNSSVSTVTSSDSNEFFLAVESFLAPPVIIRGVVNIQDTIPLVADITFTPLGHLAPASNQDLVTRQIMYPSHDGTSIPMFISHAHGLDMTKEHPVLLHGYGGFQVANTPSYSPFWPAFIRQVGGM
jgi:prolyl oligopeptidase